MPIAKQGSNFEPAPPGTHVARCYGCVSLGTQHSEMFADAFKVMLLFELPFELIQTQEYGEKPMTISKEYSLSLGKKANLRKHLDSWRGRSFSEEELKGFEVSNVVGAPCQITVVHSQSSNGNTYAKIESITGLAKGMTCPNQAHASIKYEIEHGKNEVFTALPEWIRKKIEASEELNPGKPQTQQVVEPEPMGDAEDRMPF